MARLVPAESIGLRRWKSSEANETNERRERRLHQNARLGLVWADTRTMVYTPCGEDGINAQAFAVTFNQVGTFEPTTIGTTSPGNCLLTLVPDRSDKKCIYLVPDRLLLPWFLTACCYPGP